MLELALLSPWVVMLFIGILDWGFYSYCLISLEAAARSAAMNARLSATSAADSATACTIVLGEMKSLPNVKTLASCGASPLTVTATLVTGPDSANAAQVSITYQTPSMIALPGLLAKQFTITRVVTMRI
jgi:hypothetical protein